MLVHNLAGLLHIDFRLPGAADYTTFLRATRLLTRDEREVEKPMIGRLAMLFHNRDDHPKIWLGVLAATDTGAWRPHLTLIFSTGPMGQHHMDVCGEGAAIERGHLLRLAQEGRHRHAHAKHSIDRMLPHAASRAGRLADFPAWRATAQVLCATVAGLLSAADRVR